MGLIYIISEAESGPVKIGICRDGGLVARLKSLQTGNPRPLRLCTSFHGRDWMPVKTERALHRFLDAFRLTGEWFNLSESIAAAEIKKFLEANHFDYLEVPIDLEQSFLEFGVPK